MLRFKVRNGTRSSAAIDPSQVVDLGEGPEAILFLHGLFGSPEHWIDVMNRLSDRYRVIAPQLPIDPQPGRRRDGIKVIRDLSDMVSDLVDSIDVDSLVVSGNSLGGLVAIDLCARDPNFAQGLVLAGSAGLFERSPIKGLRSRPNREFVRSTIGTIVSDQRLVTDELVDRWCATMKDRDYVRFVLRVSRAARDRTVESELAQLKIPTMIIWGRDDEITPPSTGEEFRRRIEGSQLRFIDDCGHAPNWEQPEAFADLLADFLPKCFS
jgi:2-hydroxy-6-oxonona-2,4-dienedioate hydrolase